MLDERLVTALHVETLRRDQIHAEHEPHVYHPSLHLRGPLP
jgi:hypothetical protein